MDMDFLSRGLLWTALIFFKTAFPHPSPSVQAQTDSSVSPASVDSFSAADPGPAAAPFPRRVEQVVARDLENDAGGAIQLTWTLSPDDHTGGSIKEYLVLRSDTPKGPFTELGQTTSGDSTFVDNQAVTGQPYYYKIAAVSFARAGTDSIRRVTAESETTGPAVATAQWFNSARWNILLGILIISGAIIYYIVAAKSGRAFYIRKIAGIEEVENAVGRATEMGRSVYFVPGYHDMDDVQTLASMAILGRVAQVAAQNGTRIDVPVARSMVMVTARETVREVYGRAGRPDLFQDDQVRYLTDDQFGYAAAVDGLFVREKPGTIFFVGAFFGEALVMAETGNSIGAIQIAGTAQPAQLPFFVAACDYTLIGEELFAASAYLSREPKLLGSLKGQDFGKALFLAAIVVGIILEMIGWDVSGWFSG
ncbi:MAG: fibronectin type III domain-containing protein [candidate division Zixibacteria bacterium]|nr:fibronectin type III domain-containing protein [candidate division Zixibacteria bacterium]